MDKNFKNIIYRNANGVLGHYFSLQYTRLPAFPSPGLLKFMSFESGKGVRKQFLNLGFFNHHTLSLFSQLPATWAITQPAGDVTCMHLVSHSEGHYHQSHTLNPKWTGIVQSLAQEIL